PAIRLGDHELTSPLFRAHWGRRQQRHRKTCRDYSENHSSSPWLGFGNLLLSQWGENERGQRPFTASPRHLIIHRVEGAIAMKPIEYSQASAETRAVYDDIKATRKVDDVNNF